MRRYNAKYIIGILAACLLTCFVQADVTMVWDDGAVGNHLWRDGANWDTDTAPTEIDHRARITEIPAGGAGPLVDSLTDVSCAHLIVGLTTTGVQTNMTMTGGSIQVRDYLRLGNDAGTDGTLNISDGLINVGLQLIVGHYGTGTLNMSGGTINAGAAFRLGWYAGGVGVVNMSGGVINVNAADFAIRTGSQIIMSRDAQIEIADPNGLIQPIAAACITDGRIVSAEEGVAVSAVLNKGVTTISLSNLSGILSTAIVHLDSQHVVIGQDPEDAGVMRVIKMLDRSGNGNDAVQNGGNQWMPTYVTEAVNGYPAVRFDGVHNFLNIEASEDFDTNQFTWYIVMEAKRKGGMSVMRSSYADAGNGTAYISIWGNYTADYQGLGMIYYMITHSRTNTGGIKTAYNTSTGAFELYDDQWFLLTGAWYDGTQIAQWVGGGAAINYKRSSGANAMPTGHRGTGIGSYYGGTSSFLDGNIAEIIIFDRKLASAEMNTVGSYLATKYNMPLTTDTLYTNPVVPANCEQLWSHEMGNPIDLNKDCIVGIDDIFMFSEQWMSDLN